MTQEEFYGNEELLKLLELDVGTCLFIGLNNEDADIYRFMAVSNMVMIELFGYNIEKNSYLLQGRDYVHHQVNIKDYEKNFDTVIRG